MSTSQGDRAHLRCLVPNLVHVLPEAALDAFSLDQFPPLSGLHFHYLPRAQRPAHQGCREWLSCPPKSGREATLLREESAAPRAARGRPWGLGPDQEEGLRNHTRRKRQADGNPGVEVAGLTSPRCPWAGLAPALTARGPSVGGELGGAAQALRPQPGTEEADRQPPHFGVRRSGFTLQV